MPADSSHININAKGIKKNTFDAIVIGSGISGGWAAKELCEHGLKTLVLERGRDVKHIKDYPTATLASALRVQTSWRANAANAETKSCNKSCTRLW